MATKYVQARRSTLRASINDTTTTCVLTGFLDLSGNPIVQADIGTTGYGTFEPNSDREEAFSFTIDSNTAAGVATLTITRGLLGKAPYGVGGTAFAHNSGTEVIISNNPSLLNKLTAKDNNEVVTGSWEFPAPTGNQSPATKLYVDSVVTGGTVSNNRIVEDAVAGATIAAGDLVYFDETAIEWLKTAGATASTLNNVKIGIAQGAGADGAAISGGVLTYGVDATQTGLTPGVKLYAGDVSGSIVETPGTIERCIGAAKSATEIYFDPIFNNLPTGDEKDAISGGGDFGSPSTSNKFLTEEYPRGLDLNFGDGSDGDVTISTPTTLTRDMFYNNLVVTSTLDTNGYRVFVKDTVSGAGTVRNNGNNGGAGVIGGTGSGTGNPGGGAAAKGAGIFKSVAGSAGTIGTDGSPATLAGVAGIDGNKGAAGSAGGAGGRGYDTGTGAGGAAGALDSNKPIYDKFGALHFAFYSAAGTLSQFGLSGGGGGSGGAGRNTFTRGGGGGGSASSGGVILIFAKRWTGTFTIEAIGGVGGAGGAGGGSASECWGGGGGGAGGVGGVVIAVYGVKTWTGTYTLTGGAGGTGGVAGPAPSAAGANGSAGNPGVAYEYDISTLM